MHSVQPRALTASGSAPRREPPQRRDVAPGENQAAAEAAAKAAAPKPSLASGCDKQCPAFGGEAGRGEAGRETTLLPHDEPAEEAGCEPKAEVQREGILEEVAEDAATVVGEVEGAAAAAASLRGARLGGVGGGTRVRGEASERVHPGKSEANPPGVQGGAGEYLSSGSSLAMISIDSGESSRELAGERARSRSSCAVSGDGSKAEAGPTVWGESRGEGGGGGLCKLASFSSRRVRWRIAVAPHPGEGM